MPTADTYLLVRTQNPLYQQAVDTVLNAGKPSISLLIRVFVIGYSSAKALILAMEGDVIKRGELDRYTTFLKNEVGGNFELELVTHELPEALSGGKRSAQTSVTAHCTSGK